MKNVKLKSEVIAAIEAKAVEWKFSKAKATELAEIAVSMTTRSYKGVGKKANPETVELRQKVKNWMNENIGQKFTVRDLAERFSVKPVEINNVLLWLGVVKVGVADRIPGKRGKNASLFEAAHCDIDVIANSNIS